MSGSLTPYDKKAYRESKRRRKQALKAEKTGRIMPINKNRRKIIITISALAVILVSTVCGFFVISYFADSEGESAHTVTEVENNELLTVVSQSHPLEQSYVPALEQFESFQINALMLDSISEMLENAYNDGVELKIINAYIPFEEQQKMYEQKLKELLESTGYTQVRAESEAQRTIPKGGNSEFQTGLLIDFDISDSQVSVWLERNCVKYGFILRYPEGKEDVCNHSASDSIYRYVGKNNAVNMRSYNMTLEEYKSYLEVRQNQ